MKGTLTQNGQETEATSENVLAALAGTDFFWLDLDDSAQDGTVAELLGVHFKFHPLAVAAAERFAVRPRFDDYDDFVYMAVRGADPHDTGEAEVHCFWTDRYIVTVHRGDCPSVHGRAQPDGPTPCGGEQCVPADRHRLPGHERTGG